MEEKTITGFKKYTQKEWQEHVKSHVAPLDVVVDPVLYSYLRELKNEEAEIVFSLDAFRISNKEEDENYFYERTGKVTGAVVDTTKNTLTLSVVLDNHPDCYFGLMSVKQHEYKGHLTYFMGFMTNQGALLFPVSDFKCFTGWTKEELQHHRLENGIVWEFCEGLVTGKIALPYAELIKKYRCNYPIVGKITDRPTIIDVDGTHMEFAG